MTHDLADRLRRWLEADTEGSEVLNDLVARTAVALEQAARGEEVLDEDGRNGRQVSYKEVLATRGERHRPDGTPLWPLRPDDFPSSLKQGASALNGRAAHSADTPDWML